MKIKNKILILSFLLFPLYFVLNSCSPTEPPNNGNINLQAEDVSCTEAWLKLETQNLSLPASVSLLQNNSVGQIINLSKPDTIIYVDSLLPNKTYSFQISGIGDPVSGIRSNKVSVTTLDTTSHNFSWQTFTFGEEGAGSSYLNDVAIINENNIWALGAIYLNDSTGNPDPSAYNAVHWNGDVWKLFKLQFFTFCGQTHTGSYPARAVFSLNNGTVLISSGSQLTYIKDEKQFKTECVDVSINSIWGKSSEDFYIVGNGGGIAHYQKGQWSKIESGTNIRLTDIYGTPDGRNIWACGWDNDHPNSIILEIEPSSKINIIWDGISNNGEFLNSISTVWSNGGEYWIAGGFVYRHSLLFADHGHLVRTKGYKLFDPGNFTLRIRGTEKNNIYIAGDLGMLWHFNGLGWHKYNELYNEQFDRRLNTIDIKGNVIAAAGWKGAKAWIIVGEIN